jgi:hypothetical protein
MSIAVLYQRTIAAANVDIDRTEKRGLGKILTLQTDSSIIMAIKVGI